ncbi:MAG: HAD hydrolase-like protein, partial [Lawsonibacter sp.]
MRPYRAVCFDFDYTLGDSTDSIVAGFQYGLTQLGWPAPDREAVRNTIGYMLEDAYTMLTGDDSPENRAKFRPLFLSVAKERQRRETVLFPGAVELLHSLKENGIQTAIVSTKRGDTIQSIMERCGVLHDLEFIIGSEHVALPKPDPQGLLMSMDRLKLPPQALL